MLKTTLMFLCASILMYSVSAQAPSLNLTEGQVCKQEDSRISTCKYAYDCPQAPEDYKKTGKKPVLCNFQDKHPVVCCEPEDSLPPPGTKSKQMCKQYAASVWIKIWSELDNEYFSVDTCPSEVYALIIGGTNAEPKKYPHMALIGYGSKDAKLWLCGGSLISERYVLSAAHCSNSSQGLAKWVLLGEYNKMSTTDEEKELSQPIEYEIIKRVDHPGYQPPSLYHDITLYQLDRDVQFNEYMRPICLNTEYDVHKPHATATGWTRIDNDGFANFLQNVNLTLLSKEECRAKYSEPNSQLQNGILDASMLCAGYGEEGPCQGDTGGPLQLRLDDPYCVYSQIGVVSFGEACAIKSGVYTRVSHYISWIERTVWP